MKTHTCPVSLLNIVIFSCECGGGSEVEQVENHDRSKFLVFLPKIKKNCSGQQKFRAHIFQEAILLDTGYGKGEHDYTSLD